MANELYKGSQKIKEIYLGTTKIGKVYKGNTLVYQANPYKAGQVLFESATPGTYSLDLLANGIYKVWVVGGGAGGSRLIGNASGGGSGAAFVGEIRLSKKLYSIQVGNFGNGNPGGGSSSTREGSDGNPSSIGDLIIAGGGYTGGDRAGGTLKLNITAISSEISSNGRAPSSGTGGASLYNGYGAGGNGESNRNYASKPGTVGYVKVQFVSL